MTGGGPRSLDPLSSALREVWWVDSVTVEDGDIEVWTAETPDLRDVYDAIERRGDGDVTVTVDGPSGAWTVDGSDGEVRDVYRVGGEYTVHRMSATERLLHGVSVLGVFVILAAILTAAASLVLVTPLSLLGLGTLAGVGGMLAVGLILLIGGNVLFFVAPGLTHGETAAEPGSGIEGFDRLSTTDRAALVAMDDAKSEWNYQMLLYERQPLGYLAGFGFAAYLALIGWLNAGAVGVLLVSALYVLRAVVRVVGVLVLLGTIDPLEDDVVDELLDELREAGDVSTSPTVYGVGEPDDVLEANVAMALPELDVLLVPRADVERLHREDLKAIIAHELKHVQSHYPLGLELVKAALVLAPGVALLATGATPSAEIIFVGLLGYFAAVNAGLAAVRQRWEFQADAFASEVSSPLGLAFGLTRLTIEHVVDANDESLLAGPTGELYGSHPYPHRRMARLIRDAVE